MFDGPAQSCRCRFVALELNKLTLDAQDLLLSVGDH